MFNKSFFTSILLSFLILCSSIGANPVYASEITSKEAIKVLLDGKYLNFDVPPVEVDGRTLVPLRAIFEGLGATISWDSSSNTVTGIKGTTKVVLQLDNPTAYVNGSPVELSVPGKLINNKTMVPTRFIAESMNSVVSWDEGTKTVIIVPDKEIEFKDNNLESEIKTQLKITKSKLTTSDVAQLKRLYISGKKLTSLEGLQYCINLENLSIIDAEVMDINQISGLIKLNTIYLNKNKISDITPLKNLENLKTIFIQDNFIEDISTFSNFKKLETLSLGNNKVSNISYLKNLTSIKNLFLYGTLVQDISPISSLNKLEMLNLASTQIDDIKAIKENKDLNFLNIYGTAVIDLTPIKSLKKINNFIFESTKKNTIINDELFVKYDILSSRAKSIIDKLITANMSDIDKERAIHDYIILNTKYDNEGYVNGTVSDDTHSAYGVLLNNVGVCDGYAYAMKALLNLVNVRSLIVYGESFNLSSMPINHAWNMVILNGQYYHTDLTWDDLGSTDNNNNNIQHKFFNISDKQISVNHRYQNNYYPVANIDSNDYTSYINDTHRIIFTDDAVFTAESGYIFRIDNKTKIAKKLSEDKVYEIVYNNGWIYYTNYSDNYKVYKIKTDGTEKTLVGNEKAVHLFIINDNIYYIDMTDNLNKLNKMDLDGKNKKSINSDYITTTLYYFNDALFFKAYNQNIGSAFNRINFDGTGKTTVTTSLSGFIKENGGVRFSFNSLEKLNNDWLYYVDSSSDNNLYKIKLDGTQKTKLSDDNISSYTFYISGDWIYYRSTNDSNKICKIKIDGTQKTLLE